jgi:zinc protease
LRQLVRETESLALRGLTAAEFKLGQGYLMGAAPLMAAGIERRLGYAIDSVFYGIKGDYLKDLQSQVRGERLAHVNKVLKAYIRPEFLDLVVVTPDAEKFKAEALSPRCEIHYAPGVSKDAAVLAEDQKIATASVGVRPEDIEIVDAASLFEK